MKQDDDIKVNNDCFGYFVHYKDFIRIIVIKISWSVLWKEYFAFPTTS